MELWARFLRSDFTVLLQVRRHQFPKHLLFRQLAQRDVPQPEGLGFLCGSPWHCGRYDFTDFGAARFEALRGVAVMVDQIDGTQKALLGETATVSFRTTR